MTRWGSDQTESKGKGYFCGSLQQCETRYKEIFRTKTGLDWQVRDKKPEFEEDSFHNNAPLSTKGTTTNMTIDQTCQGDATDKVIIYNSPESRNMNFSKEDPFQTQGTRLGSKKVSQNRDYNGSREVPDETSKSSEQDRIPCSRNRQSRATGMLAEHPPPARANGDKSCIDLSISSENHKWEGHRHPDTDPRSTKSTDTNKTIDQTWKGGVLAFTKPRKSQITQSHDEDISQSGDSTNSLDPKGMNSDSRVESQIIDSKRSLEESFYSLEDPDKVYSNKSRNDSNQSLGDSDGSREDPDETGEALGQNRVPRSRDKQWAAMELPAQHALSARSKSIHTQLIPEQFNHSVVVDGQTIFLDSYDILDPYNFRLELSRKSDDPFEVCYLQVSRHILLGSHLNLEVFALILTKTQVTLS